MERYEPKAIEERWQRVWEDAAAFHVDNPPDPDYALVAVHGVRILVHNHECAWGSSGQ